MTPQRQKSRRQKFAKNVNNLKLSGACKTTGKRKYKIDTDVLIANIGNPKDIRAYKCQFCGFWHGTSHPLKSSWQENYDYGDD